MALASPSPPAYSPLPRALEFLPDPLPSSLPIKTPVCTEAWRWPLRQQSAVFSGCWLFNKPALILPNSCLRSYWIVNYWLMGGKQQNLSSVTHLQAIRVII